MADSSETITKLREKNRKLTARVKTLEAILICAECGHLRSQHEDDDAPCFGGRAGLKANEGDYCMCSGFRTEEAE